VNKVIPLERSDKPIEAKEFMERLGINNEKLRRYTAQFKVYRTFPRENGRILYSEQDYLLFRKMIQLHKDGHGTIAKCIAIVCEQGEFLEFRKQAADLEEKEKFANNANFVNIENQLNTALQEIQKLHELRKQDEQVLFRTQDEFRKLRDYVDNRINERDQSLLGMIRELQKEKRRKKRKWWQFFWR